MKPQQSAQLLLSQISALDEVIGEPISQNIPAKILLHMFIDEGATAMSNSRKLNEAIDSAPSTFDRYIRVLASEGMIVMSQTDPSENAELRLSETVKTRLESVFHSPL